MWNNFQSRNNPFESFDFDGAALRIFSKLGNYLDGAFAGLNNLPSLINNLIKILSRKHVLEKVIFVVVI